MVMPNRWPDCIEATVLNSQGYGRDRLNGKGVMKHRLSYCQSKGIQLDDIKGLLVRHKCDNPACYNPEHLEIGTHKDNSRDMVERGRAVKWGGIRKGDGNPKAKLTPEQVDEIRKIYVPYNKEFGGAAPSIKYGVNFKTISDIIIGKTWAT